jgi:HEPN domain-containing protein
LSGEYVARLKRRALAFLRAVDHVDDADLAAFFAEQAMQLYIMAVFYEIFGERVRGHELKTLLGILSRDLKKYGYESMAAEVDHFVDEYRRGLIAAEEAYIGGRYGELGYSEEDSRRLRDVARRLIEVLDEVVEDVKLG